MAHGPRPEEILKEIKHEALFFSRVRVRQLHRRQGLYIVGFARKTLLTWDGSNVRGDLTARLPAGDSNAEASDSPPASSRHLFYLRSFAAWAFNASAFLSFISFARPSALRTT